MATGIEVTPVRGGTDRAAFVNLPLTIYRGDGLWVPPLKTAVQS